MYNLSKSQQIKDYLFNAFGAPFIAIIFLFVFPFIYFTDYQDFTKKEKLSIFRWCLYAFAFYPIYLLHYTFYLHKKEFIERLKSNFLEQIEVKN